MWWLYGAAIIVVSIIIFPIALAIKKKHKTLYSNIALFISILVFLIGLGSMVKAFLPLQSQNADTSAITNSGSPPVSAVETEKGAATPSADQVAITPTSNSTSVPAIETGEKTVSSIKVSTMPNEIKYSYGDSVITLGLVLEVTYSDNSADYISSGYTYSPKIFTTADKEQGGIFFVEGTPYTDITVSYGDATTTFSVVLLPGYATTNQLASYMGKPFDLIINDKKATIAKYTGSGGNVTIPASIDGIPVIGIGTYAFYQCDDLTSLTIESGVTSIGQYAFAECSNLVTANIPDSVTTIGCDAFSICSSLNSVTIPSGLTKIEHTTFFNCKSLTSVVIPASVVSIDYDAFTFDSSLTAAKFEGNAPSFLNSSGYDIGWTSHFLQCNPDFTIYYHPSAFGWSSPTWNGYNTATW